MTTVTVNTAETCPATPGTFQVRAFYTETDAGHPFGTFTTRERAEACLLTLAARPAVIRATLEPL